MEQVNINIKTINDLELYQVGKAINAHTTSKARIFSIADLQDVYIMENDLYGNVMPMGSFFLAFNGRNGLMGIQILIDTLRKSSPSDIGKIVDANNNG